MAPEALGSNEFSIECQVWSLGVILYETFISRVPWKAKIYNKSPTAHEFKEKGEIIQAIYETPVQSHIDDKLIDLIEKVNRERGNE